MSLRGKRARGLLGVRFERVEPAVAGRAVVADEEFAVGVEREAGDLERGGGDLLVPLHRLAVVLHAPRCGRWSSRRRCTRPRRSGKLLAVVDDAAGQRPGFRVVVFDGRLDERRRPGLAVEVERVAALRHAPAVVVALLDEVRLLPQVLAVVADPEVAGLRVVADAPRVAQAVGPRLGREALVIDERVVLRDASTACRSRADPRRCAAPWPAAGRCAGR